MQAVACTGLRKLRTSGLRLGSASLELRRGSDYPVGDPLEVVGPLARRMAGDVRGIRDMVGATLRSLQGAGKDHGCAAGRSLAVRRASLKVWVMGRRILSLVESRFDTLVAAGDWPGTGTAGATAHRRWS